MFTKILIANRGEIAVRIQRACRELGIATVAVFSEGDRASLHVRYADEAYLVGPTPARDSYLDMDRILEVAHASGAQAVHPGYGFLAEREEFARRCEAAGVAFIGPPSQAIRALGTKTAARQLATRIGVPVIPGEEEGKLLPAARHIEVQILADRSGHTVSLGERESSIQRQHQKVIEEAPCPIVDPDLRARMGEAAVRLAREAGYVNAGTMEFLVDADRRFYFLEASTCLQVGHPVTEMVTGLDLVKTQIRLAAGEPLALWEEEFAIRGAAIECRICAEDPFRGFVPSSGRILGLREPGGPGVRVDSGVYEGYDVLAHYDPLIAKVITWGRDRVEAVERMRRALREYSIQGIKITIPFHQQVMADAAFFRADVDTTYIDRRFPDRPHAWSEAERETAVIAASVHAFLTDRARPAAATEGMGTAVSPWVLAARQAGMRR
jgi:acetyl-CoA carboxylase biotin carboxylase subunit